MSTLNRYSYALNNPLIYIDPTGHSSITVSIGAGSGGSGYWGSDPWGQYSHFSEPARGGGGAGSGSSSAGADAPSVPANTQSAGNYQAGLSYINSFLTMGLSDHAQASFSSGNYAQGVCYLISGTAVGVLNLATLGGTSAAAQLTTRVTASLGRPALFSTTRHILASEAGAVGGARGAI